MAFTPLSLKRVFGHGLQGPSLWLYSTLDAMTTVDNTDYFANGKMLGMSVGDPVMVSKTDGPNLYIAKVSAIDSDGNATVSAGSEMT